MSRAVFRPHDDNDGDRSQGLHLVESADGDMWVFTSIEEGRSLRFRVPFIGGGGSHRTWEALRDLQVAMEMDNHPQLSFPFLREASPISSSGLTSGQLLELSTATSDMPPETFQPLVRELLLARQWIRHRRQLEIAQNQAEREL